jgi:hypothetical protein
MTTKRSLVDRLNQEGAICAEGFLFEMERSWNPSDQNSQKEVRGMFEEMIGWAVDEGADMLVGETFYFAEEAYCALEL